MQGPKQLLVFAHRPEAQCFIKNDHLTPVFRDHHHLLKGDNYYLLICGEGTLNGLMNTSHTLGRLPEIQEVWNFGIAGSLSEKYKLHEIIPIRTTYGEWGEDLQFKSMTSNFRNTARDCFTSNQRVLNTQQAQKYIPFAEIVDRECWSIGMACLNYKKDFYPVKLISDFPLNEKGEFCTIIKEQAEIYSDLLYRWWIDHTSPSPKEKNDSLTAFFPEFYFTFSLEHRFEKLLGRYLDNKNNLELQLEELKKTKSIQQIIKSELSSKQKTLQLISLLEYTLDPELNVVFEKQEELSKELKRNGAHLKFDPDFEENWIDIKIRLTNEIEKENFIQALNRFSFKKLNSLLQGDQLD